MYRRQHHRGRTAFIVVLATCWAVGLIGLEGGRTASLRLFVIAGLVLVAVSIGGALRRAIGPRPQLRIPPRTEPSNCIVIRPLGSDDHPSGRGWH